MLTSIFCRWLQCLVTLKWNGFPTSSEGSSTKASSSSSAFPDWFVGITATTNVPSCWPYQTHFHQTLPTTSTQGILPSTVQISTITNLVVSHRHHIIKIQGIRQTLQKNVSCAYQHIFHWLPEWVLLFLDSNHFVWIVQQPLIQVLNNVQISDRQLSGLGWELAYLNEVPSIHKLAYIPEPNVVVHEVFHLDHHPVVKWACRTVDFDFSITSAWLWFCPFVLLCCCWQDDHFKCPGCSKKTQRLKCKGGSTIGDVTCVCSFPRW